MVEPSSTYCEKGCFAEPFQADSKALGPGKYFIIVEKSSLSKWGVVGSGEMRVDWLVFIERGSQRLRGTKLNNFQNKASSESNQSSGRQIVDSNTLECRSRHCSLWIVVITQREVTRLGIEQSEEQSDHRSLIIAPPSELIFCFFCTPDSLGAKQEGTN